MNAARRRLPPRPRSRPHPFRTDPTIAPTPTGRLTCRCGSLDTDAVHRTDTDQTPRLDVARLVAGERDTDDL